MGLIMKNGVPYGGSKDPIATTTTTGIVRPDGSTITVDADGTIHGSNSYELPTASTETLGGVKVDGTTVTIDENGVLHCVGQTLPDADGGAY